MTGSFALKCGISCQEYMVLQGGWSVMAVSLKTGFTVLYLYRFHHHHRYDPALKNKVYKETCFERPLPCRTTCLEGPLFFLQNAIHFNVNELVTKMLFHYWLFQDVFHLNNFTDLETLAPAFVEYNTTGRQDRSTQLSKLTQARKINILVTLVQPIFKPNPCFAWLFLTFTLCVCLCSKYLKKY